MRGSFSRVEWLRCVDRISVTWPRQGEGHWTCTGHSFPLEFFLSFFGYVAARWPLASSFSLPRPTRLLPLRPRSSRRRRPISFPDLLQALPPLPPHPPRSPRGRPCRRFFDRHRRRFEPSRSGVIIGSNKSQLVPTICCCPVPILGL